ncbi:MAG: class I SAM-dependent methyltransferase [Kiritimatiellae bacterium]|nr:class I SAM-dependent methyltransferase [Kiritimatiellia bacterium]
MDLEFTGEFFIPGKSPQRIADDHIERYRFASGYARGRAVLDIACGVGYGTRLLADAGAVSVDGVDISAANVDYAREHYGSDRARFLQGDIASFGADAAYDLIVCFETIEHVPDHREALVNLKRVLRPGGQLLISSPNRPITSPKARRLSDRPGNPYHVREFMIVELSAELTRAGFDVNPEEVYGQRQQRYFRFRPLARLYAKRFRPEERFSPVVTRVARRVPRYFIIVAARPA